MITDFFARRYDDVELFAEYEERHRRFLQQAHRLITDEVYPFYNNGKINEESKKELTLIHDLVATELGLSKLGDHFYTYPVTVGGNTRYSSSPKGMKQVLEDFVCVQFSGNLTADVFLKNRLSLIEIAFRQRQHDIEKRTSAATRIEWLRPYAAHAARRGIRLPAGRADNFEAIEEALWKEYNQQVDDLNERFRQAGIPLTYHNGYLQISDDHVAEAQIAKPFWSVVSHSDYKNVEEEMLDALDRRDNGRSDPEFHAAKALESAIKIVCEKRGCVTGREKGAINFIERLASENGSRFIADWEADMLKAFFGSVRRPQGHGSGSEEKVRLSKEQVDWAIEFCMSWCKSLVSRL